jgi:type II secretory pathway pseudopilin PulG
MAIIATALTLAVTKYVAKSKRSSDANTAGELKTAAETTVTDYLTSKDDLGAGTITITGGTTGTRPWDFPNDGAVKGYVKDDFQKIFESAAGKTAPQSKVHPSESFKITITIDKVSNATYEVNYTKTSTDIFAEATK